MQSPTQPEDSRCHAEEQAIHGAHSQLWMTGLHCSSHQAKEGEIPPHPRSVHATQKRCSESVSEIPQWQ